MGEENTKKIAQKINADFVYFDEKTKKFEYLGKTFDSLMQVYSYFDNVVLKKGGNQNERSSKHPRNIKKIL